MTSANVHLLAGAYALGAIDGDERPEFEEHLANCQACKVEVGEFLATSARLALAAAETPPSTMRQRVLHRITEVRQDPPTVDLPASHARRSPSTVRCGTAFVVAAGITAAASLGGIAAWQYDNVQSAHQQIQQAQAQAAQIAAVLSAPDARTVVGTIGGPGRGANATVVTSRSQDKAVFLTSGLPKLPAGKTYQFWFDDAGVMRPAGLVASVTSAQTILLKGSIGPARDMGITVEPTSGSLHPTSAPVALMAFPGT